MRLSVRACILDLDSTNGDAPAFRNTQCVQHASNLLLLPSCLHLARTWSALNDLAAVSHALEASTAMCTAFLSTWMDDNSLAML